MTYETFLKLIPEMVQSDLGEWVKVRLHTIRKNNNVKREALCILEEGSNVSPTIYLQPYYEYLESGMPLEQVCREICQEYKTNRCGIYLDVEEFRDFDRMKGRIVYKLIHYESNRELLQDVPHRRFLDLAVVYYLLIEHHFIGSGTALIHQQQCHQWQIEESVLYEQAVNNTDRLLGCEIQPIRQVIMTLLQQDMKRQLSADLAAGVCAEAQIDRWAMDILARMLPRERYAMYVVSNHSKFFGAAAVLNTERLEAFAESMGSGFYVIPSSIHEMILLPETEETDCSLSLKELLKEINESEDNIQEFLSDQIYYFDRHQGFRIVREM